MTSRRITTAYLADLADRLSDRDRQVIDLLRRTRVGTARQIQRAVFTEATPRSNARMAQRTLKRLVSMRVLMRLDRPPGGYGGGSLGHVFALDVAGQRLARGGHVRTVRRPWPVSSLFLRHGLDVTEWYVRLREAERSGAIELLEFVAEDWRQFVTGHGNPAILKPDAFVRLVRKGWEEQWFLEIDQATEHTPALKRQLDQYVVYWHSGAEQQWSDGLFPQVLWIVPSEKRHGELIDVIGRLPTEAWPLFQVATKSSAISILTVGVPP